MELTTAISPRHFYFFNNRNVVITFVWCVIASRTKPGRLSSGVLNTSVFSKFHLDWPTSI